MSLSFCLPVPLSLSLAPGNSGLSFVTHPHPMLFLLCTAGAGAGSGGFGGTGTTATPSGADEDATAKEAERDNRLARAVAELLRGSGAAGERRASTASSTAASDTRALQEALLKEAAARELAQQAELERIRLVAELESVKAAMAAANDARRAPDTEARQAAVQLQTATAVEHLPPQPMPPVEATPPAAETVQQHVTMAVREAEVGVPSLQTDDTRDKELEAEVCVCFSWAVTLGMVLLTARCVCLFRRGASLTSGASLRPPKLRWRQLPPVLSTNRNAPPTQKLQSLSCAASSQMGVWMPHSNKVWLSIVFTGGHARSLLSFVDVVCFLCFLFWFWFLVFGFWFLFTFLFCGGCSTSRSGSR